MSGREVSVRLAMPVVNRRLPELVFQRFSRAPGYLMIDDEGGGLEYIDNFARNIPAFDGSAAAALLGSKGVDAVILGEAEERCIAEFHASGVEVFGGFVGTCEQAVSEYRSGNLMSSAGAPAAELPERLSWFDFIDVEHRFEGQNIVYADWDFLRPMEARAGSPEDWTVPVNYSRGYYLLCVEISGLAPVTQPVEIEFGFFNRAEVDDPDRLERCSFGQYSRITGPGKWMHFARLEDMETTTLDGREGNWDWTHAWHAPFVLLKPFAQQPYPFDIELTVRIVAGEGP